MINLRVEKQKPPFGPTELDFEAGKLFFFYFWVGWRGQGKVKMFRLELCQEKEWTSKEIGFRLERIKIFNKI